MIQLFSGVTGKSISVIAQETKSQYMRTEIVFIVVGFSYEQFCVSRLNSLPAECWCYLFKCNRGLLSFHQKGALQNCKQSCLQRLVRSTQSSLDKAIFQQEHRKLIDLVLLYYELIALQLYPFSLDYREYLDSLYQLAG